MKKIGSNFIEGTKYKNLSVSDQMTGKSRPPDELLPDESAIAIQLPVVEDFGEQKIDLSYAIKMRKSVREFKNEALSPRELAYLLWTTHGIKEHAGNQSIRTVPSAGGRYAIDAYLYLHNVLAVEPGLYRFYVQKNILLLINQDDTLSNALFHACLEQQMVTDCAVVFFWVADIYRMTWRYSERGYRYIFLDAGHICQNLYLGAQQVNCGICAMSAFDDDKVNTILEVDGINRFAIYAAALGKAD